MESLELPEFNMDFYIPPEEYPDWDGDESIMYYLDHIVDDNDDNDDEEDEYFDDEFDE